MGEQASLRVARARVALTSTVLVAEVGEAPDISQADNLPSHRQDVLQLVVPLPSLQGLVLLLLLHFHDGVCGHSFTIADSTRDSVIHPTFRRSFLRYVQHKPCNKQKFGMQEAREGRGHLHTHMLNLPLLPLILIPVLISCWQQGAETVRVLSLLSPKTVLKSLYQFLFFFFLLTHFNTLFLLEAQSLSTVLHRRPSSSARLELPPRQVQATDLRARAGSNN